MPRRLTTDFVRNEFAKVGWELLGEYVKASALLEFRCNEGHYYRVRWNDFQQGQRCAFCAGRYSVTTKSVRDEFAKVGWVLLSEYTGANDLLSFICDRSHRHQITWAAFRQGQRCGVCYGKLGLTTEFVRGEFAKAGWQLLGEYVNSTTPLDFICDRFHRHQITWSNFQSGQGCGACYGKIGLTTELVRKEFAKVGWELLSDYVGAHDLLSFACDKKHHHQITWTNFQSGKRCGLCHASNFYAAPKNKSRSRIIASINQELKRFEFDAHWTYYYSDDLIKTLAEGVQSIYDACPQGYAVDHILPVSYFNLLKESELVICWSPNNLRHLEAVANSQRGNKMSAEEIAFMRSSHPEIFYAASRNPYLKM